MLWLRGLIMDMTQGEREFIIALVAFSVGGLCAGILQLFLS
jgi:hypothetical protein